jgi:hypothetical protein
MAEDGSESTLRSNDSLGPLSANQNELAEADETLQK